MVKILKSIGMSIIKALLTEKFIKDLILFLLKKLSEKTSNKVDDELVKKVSEALKSE